MDLNTTSCKNSGNISVQGGDGHYLYFKDSESKMRKMKGFSTCKDQLEYNIKQTPERILAYYKQWKFVSSSSNSHNILDWQRVLVHAVIQSCSCNGTIFNTRFSEPSWKHHPISQKEKSISVKVALISKSWESWRMCPTLCPGTRGNRFW